MKNNLLGYFLRAFLLTLALAGCGGGGGGGSDSPQSGSSSSSSSSSGGSSSSSSGGAGIDQIGIFVDSPVTGIHFITSSGVEGETDADGYFRYQDNDYIGFKLGSIELPEVPAASVLTPFDLFNTNDFSSDEIVNFIVLLQTLDDDGEIESEVYLPETHIQALVDTGLTFADLSQSPELFAGSEKVQKLLSSISGKDNLISPVQAISHFSSQLSKSAIIDSDGDGIPNSTDPDDDNDGVEDAKDQLPWNPEEYLDFDGDRTGDNADTDDDNDEIADESDDEVLLIHLADTGVAAVADHYIDSLRNVVYLSHKENNSVDIRDLATGGLVARLEFAHPPERMSASPDGSKLYIALLEQEHSSYWWEEEQSGYIAVVDLDTRKVIDTLTINTDPYDLVVTSGGKLIVASGSGQWTNIYAYDAENGNVLGSAGIYQQSRLSLHPSETWVFAADTGLSPSDIEKFDISGEGIVRLGDSPYHGDHRMSGNVWATPDGKYVITRGGDLFQASDMVYVKSLSPDSVAIEEVYFDTEQKLAWLTLSDGAIWALNLETFEEVNDEILFGTVIGVTTDDYSVLYIIYYQGEIYHVRKPHPCPDCGKNTAPTAAFSYSPASGDTTDNYQFDASGSSDAEDGSSLQYRWDIDNDGDWDTSFSAEPILEHSFILAGTKFIRLQVKDSSGLVASAVKSVNVAQGEDPGSEVTDSVAYGLQFSVTDTELDRQRGRLYITDKSAMRLYVVDLSTGLTERYFEFDYMPERMAIDPDGNKLYLALLVQEHSSYSWDEEQSGYIAVIDLEQQSHVNTLAIDMDPYDLVVTSGGKLVVSSGSGQWSDIRAYDAVTGSVLGSASIRHRSRLALHPSQEWVFAADTDLSPSDIEKFDISGSGIASLGDSPYHGDHRMSGNVWTTPDGNYLITRGGDIFSASDMAYVASLTETSVSIEQLSFDTDENLVFTVNSDGSLRYYNLASWQQVGTVSAEDGTEWIYSLGSSVYGLSPGTSTGYQLTETLHPCIGCGANTAPTAAFTFSPNDGDTTDTYTFDASTSSDAEDGSELRYRWDLNGDGDWDTDFSNSATKSHNFILAGTKFVQLQVKDSGGLVATVSQNINVAQGVDGGNEVGDSVAFELQFEVTDTEVDKARGKAYVTDKSAKRLYVVDLASGFTERYFQFDYMPERMALAPDNSKLYVALLTQEHSSYWWEEEQSGYIAMLDLELQSHIDTLAINTDPYDLVVTSGGKLVVSSGSGQGTNIYAYDAADGSVLGSAQISQRSKLTLHPSENWVFAADTDLSPSDIKKYDISGAGITSLGDSPYHGDYRMSGDVWATPDGQYLVTRGGDVFKASDMTYVSSLTESGISIEQLGFDTDENVLFTAASDGSVRYYNLTSLLQIGEISTTDEPEWVFALGSSVYMLAPGAGSGYSMTQTVHPCLGCGANTAPTADFSYTPEPGDTTDTYTFDASSSTDSEDDLGLQYRWDVDGDGEWDSDFSSVATREHRYTLSGTKLVRLQVKDSGGLTNTLSKNIDVVQGTDPGTQVTDSVAYELQFDITDTEVDKARNKIYITDKSAKRLYIVDLSTGLTERYFEFAQMPERMTITPDGSKLYLALLQQEHSSYWWEEEQSGYVAVFDLEQQSHINTLGIDIDPYDLVVTSGGKLIVSSGSGQWTYINAYDAADGAALGQASIRQRSRLALHPSEQWVYAANTDTSPSDIEQFDIRGEGITSLGDSPYHGDHRMNGNVWATPDGQHLVTRGGDVFLAADMTYVLSLTPQGVAIESLAFDESQSTIQLLGSDNTIYEYDYLTSFELLNSSTFIGAPEHILQSDSHRFVIHWDGQKYLMMDLSD